MDQYSVLVLTRAGGEWISHSRDFPHIRIRGSTAEQTYAEAAHAIRMEVYRLRSTGQPLPRFRSYADVCIDDTFARERGIRWCSAIARMIPFPPHLQTITNPAPEAAPEKTAGSQEADPTTLPRAS